MLACDPAGRVPGTPSTAGSVSGVEGEEADPGSERPGSGGARAELIALLEERVEPVAGVLEWDAGKGEIRVCGVHYEREFGLSALLEETRSCGCVFEGEGRYVIAAHESEVSCPDDCNTCRCGRGGGGSMTLLACEIEIREMIYFGAGQREPLRESEFVLDAAAEVLRENPKITVLELVGHRTKLEPPGLDLARAESVKAALSARGVAAGRLVTRGAGADWPIASGDDVEARARNRRVEFNVP